MPFSDRRGRISSFSMRVLARDDLAAFLAGASRLMLASVVGAALVTVLGQQAGQT
jgi:hypothetical protein